MKPFIVGDRVVCIKDFDNGGWKKLTGTVRVIREERDDFGVEFDKASFYGSAYGHNLSGFSKIPDRGWWFPYSDVDRYIKRLNENKQFEFDFGKSLTKF